MFLSVRASAITSSCVTLLLAGMCHVSGATAGPGSSVEGKIFTDWSMSLVNSETAAGIDTTLISHGFENHRAYLGASATVNDNFSGKVLLDVGRIKGVTSVAVTTDTMSDGSVAVTKVTTKADDRLEAFLKAAYLEMKQVIPLTTVTFGVKGRNQFNIQEKFWGYRYLYKSFMDQEKYGSSADLGLGVKVVPTELVEVYADVENGEGYTKIQSDTKYRSNLGVRVVPTEKVEVYAYGDFMPNRDDALETQISAAGFVGVKPVKAFRLGAEYNFQKNSGGVLDNDLNGISAYASVNAKVVDLFARVDLLSASSATVKPYEESKKVVIAGAQWSPVKNLKLSPNVQLTVPAGDDPDPVTRIAASGEFSF